MELTSITPTPVAADSSEAPAAEEAVIERPVAEQPDNSKLEAELLAAITEHGGKTPGNAYKHYKKEAPAPAKTEPAAPPGKTKDETAQPTDKPPVTQEKLSSGFAKLERQRRAVAAREAEIQTQAARIAAEREQWTKEVAESRSRWEKDNAERLEELKLLDSDELKFIESYAKRKGTTTQAIYDKWMRKVLNDGQPHPTDEVAAVKQKTEELAKQLEEAKAEAAKAKEEIEKREQAKVAAERAATERAEFVKHVTTSPAQYPLLAKEAPEDIANVAWQLATEHARSNPGQPITFATVAGHIENQLRYHAYLEAQAKTSENSEAPAEETVSAPVAAKSAPEAPAPKATVNKPELKKASSPATLNNGLTAARSGKAPRIANDDARLNAAIAQLWK